MFRTTLLCLGAAAVAQLVPSGCPLVSPPPSPAPAERGNIIVQASAPAAASVGDTVALAATAAADLEGGAISYSWLQVAGPGVSILSATQATASFLAPSLPTTQELRFLVTTTNERGDVGRAEVQVLVQADPNFGSAGPTGGTGPIARAGLDQTIAAESTGTLDGSNSRGDNLTFQWRQVGATSVTLQNADTAKATFVAPAYDPAGTNQLEFELEVTDGAGRRATDRVVITVRQRTAADDTSAKPRVRFTVANFGQFVVELNRDKAPVTVQNFLEYVADDFYNGTVFHRVIPDFVVQGGGYEPGLKKKDTRDPIKNEAGNGLLNKRGTIAMAQSPGDPDSATSQFFINLVDNASLDKSAGQPGYAVFGQVVEGMDVIDAIAAVPTGSQGGFDNVPLTDVVVSTVEFLGGSGTQEPKTPP